MPTTRIENRPTCITPGCNKKCVVRQYYNDEIANYRAWCDSCHKERSAKNAGFDCIIDYNNSTHPYRKYRKDYCENQDGRLGFACTADIIWKGMLDVDHINGNPTDNRPENLQTLCKNCHAYKTNTNKDYKTAGRKKSKSMLIRQKRNPKWQDQHQRQLEPANHV